MPQEALFMHGWMDFRDKVKRYFRFRPEEVKDILIISIVLAFAFSFSEWGEKTFDFGVGLVNFFGALIISSMAVWLSAAFHKLGGLKIGFRVEYKIWYPGLIVALIVAFMSGGKLFFLAGGYVLCHHMSIHRIGIFRYGLNVFDRAKVAYYGVAANVLLAALIKIIATGSVVIPMGAISGSVWIEKAIHFNLWYAIFNMLPIPPLSGSAAFFGSRSWYVLLYGAIICYAALVLLAGSYSLFAAILAAVVLIIAFYHFSERGSWDPYA